MVNVPFMVGVDDTGRTILSLSDGEDDMTIALTPSAVRHLIDLLAAPNTDHFWVATSDVDKLEEDEK